LETSNVGVAVWADTLLQVRRTRKPNGKTWQYRSGLHRVSCDHPPYGVSPAPGRPLRNRLRPDAASALRRFFGLLLSRLDALSICCPPGSPEHNSFGCRPTSMGDALFFAAPVRGRSLHFVQGHQSMKPNPRPALDAAMSFSLHIGGHWRGASEPGRQLSSPGSGFCAAPFQDQWRIIMARPSGVEYPAWNG